MNTDLGTKKWHPIHIHTQNELCSEINYKAYQRASHHNLFTIWSETIARNHPCHCKRKCNKLTWEREFLYKIVDFLIGFINKISIVRCQPFYYSPCIWYSSVDWTSQKLHSISIAWSYYGNCTQLNWHFPIYHTYYSSKFLNRF